MCCPRFVGVSALRVASVGASGLWVGGGVWAWISGVCFEFVVYFCGVWACKWVWVGAVVGV